MISERKASANRANARASTGPRTAAGKARAARNAQRHGLATSVLIDPAYDGEVKACAQEIAGRDAPAELQHLACRIAVAQIDLMRVREARHSQISHALNEPNDELRKDSHEIPQCASVLDAVTGSDPDKHAAILAGLASRLVMMDRYERRALSRRKSAIREYDAARALTEDTIRSH